MSSPAAPFPGRPAPLGRAAAAVLNLRGTGLWPSSWEWRVSQALASHVLCSGNHSVLMFHVLHSGNHSVLMLHVLCSGNHSVLMLHRNFQLGTVHYHLINMHSSPGRLTCALLLEPVLRNNILLSVCSAPGTGLGEFC